ncbi:MAG: GNAT family N-acetyltransferase [Promethearchaeota archaeon]
MIKKTDIVFRTLQRTDFAQVREISKDIWEGDDYVPHVFQKWIKDTDAANFGIFLPKKSDSEEEPELIAFGRVKFYSDTIAWMEGGRVKSAYQKKGVGIILTEYAIQIALEHGCNLIQYATYSDNDGSIALAQRFGFIQKDYLVFLEAAISEINFVKIPENFTYSKIPVQNIYDFMVNHLEDSPENINVGFSFFPNRPEFFQKLGSHYLWLGSKHTIVRIELPITTENHEGPEEEGIWCTIYGKSVEGFNILGDFIQKYSQLEKKAIMKVVLFVPKKIAKFFLLNGFHYDLHQENKETGEKEGLRETGVLLFEKKVE